MFWAALADGAVGEAGKAFYPVVHDDSSRHRHIYAEARGDAHDVGALADELVRQGSMLRPEDVGGAQGVAEPRQIDGVVDERDADEFAALGQPHLGGGGPVVMRDVPLAFGGV